MKPILHLVRKKGKTSLEIGGDAWIKLRAAAVDLLLTEEEDVTIVLSSGQELSFKLPDIKSFEINSTPDYIERAGNIHGEGQKET